MIVAAPSRSKISQRCTRRAICALALPEASGGEGVDAYDMAIAQQHLALGDPASALVVGMALNVLGRLSDDPVWPEPVYAAVCRDIATHGGAINTCATEAELGSVSRGGAPAATATPTDGGYLVNGRKFSSPARRGCAGW